MAISKGFFDKWDRGVTELITFLNENKTPNVFISCFPIVGISGIL